MVTKICIGYSHQYVKMSRIRTYRDAKFHYDPIRKYGPRLTNAKLTIECSLD